MSSEAAVPPSPPKLSELPRIPSDIAKAVTGGIELKKVETHEKQVLPSPADVAQEKTHVAMITDIEGFETNKLKHAETEEKQVLPSPEDLKAERQHYELKDNIEHFDAGKLKNVSTEEKVVLPSKEDLAREKTLKLAASFDKTSLKHVEPEVKQNIEVIDA